MSEQQWFPCPFCGGEPIPYGHGEHCYFSLLNQLKYSEKGDCSLVFPLLKAWNTRAVQNVSNDQLPAMADLNLQAIEELEQAQARIKSALALLRDDGHAATFQTLGQYRAALIKTLTTA
jgi:hypothetical protein